MADSPTDTLDSLLAAVRASPDEDAPRLVLADWLQDQPDPGLRDRGEFIHLQVMHDQLPADDPRREVYHRQWDKILHRRFDLWIGPLMDLVSTWTFQRGFFHLTSRGEKLFLPDVQEALVPHACWVERLGTFHLDSPSLHLLARCSLLPCLTALTLAANPITLADFEDLLAAPALAGLVRLSLARCRLVPQCMEALARCPYLGKLRFLDLSGNRLGDAGAAYLARSETLSSLRTVVIGGNDISIEGLGRLHERFGSGVLHSPP